MPSEREIDNYIDKMEEENAIYVDKGLEYAEKYHKIEEQIGCPLEVREQALVNGIYIENIYGELINFKVMLVYKNKELGYYFRIINDGYVLLTDYKKTWWLKEDRSE